MENGAAPWGFAVTSRLRTESLHASALNDGQCAETYEDVKRQQLDPASQCVQQRLQFIPLVVGAHGGGWGPSAMIIWKQLAKEYTNAMALTPPPLAVRSRSAYRQHCIENMCALSRAGFP